MVSLRKPVAFHDLGPCAQQPAFRVGIHMSDLFFQPIGKGDVILVLTGDIFPARQAYADVQCAGQSLVLVANAPDSRVGVLVENVGGLVRRSVIDDQKLEIAEALSENTLNRRADITRTIVDRK